MIGPHEGRELKLMLEGKKHLAVFHDAVPDDGLISEDIIPEKAFAPYVRDGILKRHVREFFDGKHTIRYVCFTSLEHSWRADYIFWVAELLYKGDKSFIDEQDIITGKLLGYTDDDIKEFMKRRKNYSKTKS